MENFIYNIPTKVYFGKGQLENLGSCLAIYGKNILLVYGGASIKNNGIYDTVIKQCKNQNLIVYEKSGIKPNPPVQSVREGIKICKEHNIEAVLAVGGGSVIDAAKIIACGALDDFDPWLYCTKEKQITRSLPVISVLTLSATGSEMDNTAVISNPDTLQKIGVSSPLLYPKVSFCDPEATYSVNKYQTAAGSADILSHVMEVYFNRNKGLFMLESVMETLMKTVIKYAPIALAEPNNYEARANLMWASSWAINGFISGCDKAPWSCHPMEHQLSAVYDVSHGAGLAIITPRWMKYVLRDGENQEVLDKMCLWAKNVWGIKLTENKLEAATKAIEELEKWLYDTLGLPSSFSAIGIDDSKFSFMAKNATGANGIKGWVKLSYDDVMAIYKDCI